MSNTISTFISYIIIGIIEFFLCYYIGSFFLTIGLDIAYEQAKVYMWKGIFIGYSLNCIFTLIKSKATNDIIKEWKNKE